VPQPTTLQRVPPTVYKVHNLMINSEWERAREQTNKYINKWEATRCPKSSLLQLCTLHISAVAYRAYNVGTVREYKYGEVTSRGGRGYLAIRQEGIRNPTK
jgi:hypothetical protein